ncbi:hypothetical protein BDZ45DRAFT_284807 [Acephala macrosclerotiorum]|nr:hypothetical protein BDZ45DRAFT_284807 [Acephala macrosclerotiorum]
MAVQRQSEVFLTGKDAVHHTLTGEWMVYSLPIDKPKQDLTIKNTQISTRQRYIRASAASQSQVQTTSIIEHSKPRQVAGYVSRRTDRTVNALPPPKRKAKNFGGGKEDQNDEPEYGKENKNEDGNGGRDHDHDADKASMFNPNFTQTQLSILKHQIYAFKCLTKNIGIPAYTQEQLFTAQEEGVPVAELQ